VSHPSSSHAGAADLTRQRLIRAALELFTTKGYHDTTTAQIAKKAGIAKERSIGTSRASSSS